MPSKGISAVPNDFARFLGSTVGRLEKEFRFISPSARRPASPVIVPAAKPVAKPEAVKPSAEKQCLLKTMLFGSSSCAPAKAVSPVASAPAAVAEPVIVAVKPVAPVRRVELVAAAPVEAVIAPVITTSWDNTLRGIQFTDKSEQVKAEIYFRDLRSSSKALRMEALGEIKKLSRPTMIAGLQQTLSQEQDPLQIIEILNALATIGVEAQVPKQLFIDYSIHRDTGVRLAALRAISKFNDEESFGILAPLMKDKDADVRRQVLNCLCWTFSERCLPFALKALHDVDPGVRKTASQIVGTLRSLQAVSSLISLLSDPSPDVQESASAALKKITKQDFAFKVSAAKKDRDDAIEGWRYWWRDHQMSFEREKK